MAISLKIPPFHDVALIHLHRFKVFFTRYKNNPNAAQGLPLSNTFLYFTGNQLSFGALI